LGFRSRSCPDSKRGPSRRAGSPRLDELADEFGGSRERVRQIEVRAFEKVQKAVMSRLAAAQVQAAPGAAMALA